jgi:manganese/zinc/iron transport system permease protein
MFSEIYNCLSGWDSFDTRIVVVGALAAMSCALPGSWLFLRRQSLLGDALSHSVLPGIVLAYLVLHSFEQAGWVVPTSPLRHIVLFLGATVSGVFSAVATELIQRWGRIDRGAAIGVVFTTMFAFGLLLIRMFADKTHVDPSCVLYGSLETSAGLSGNFIVPQAAVINGALFAVNGILVIAFFKELRLSTFDPELAESVGLNANAIQIALMAMTAATLVAAFESVGAILVISMLIVPPSAARLLTDRLGMMLVLSLLIAGLSSLLGHVGALTVPALLFQHLGYADVKDASTTGMMAVASGFIFVMAMIASPRHGVIRRAVDRSRLQIRIASEDVLGKLYRRDEELSSANLKNPANVDEVIHGESNRVTWTEWLALHRLHRRGLITVPTANSRLTDKGRELAQNLVRAHRLWEAYMARHFDLPGDHLHATAEQVEHFLSPELQTELAAELDQPAIDPHGRAIPPNQ